MTFPAACSLPTLALASAQSGESGPPFPVEAASNGWPEVSLRFSAIARSYWKRGMRMPLAADAWARSRTWSMAWPIAITRAL